MNFLFVCGGTAGHINPALAVATELKRMLPDARILFAGADKALEKRLVPHGGFHLVNIEMSGLRRQITPQNILYNMNTMKNLAAAGVKAEKLIRRYKPDAVIGTGGYICYPILRKAAQMGVPTLVHESNAVPGLTTKLLSASVDKVMVSFKGLEEQYRKPERVVFTGTPVREGFIHEPEARTSVYKGAKPLVLSLWGSLGAENMNEIITGFISINAETGLFDHIHSAGKNGSVDIMMNRLRVLGPADGLPDGICIREYIDDMASVMTSADIVMCRAGGSTIAELTYMGKPAILIPSPYVTNNQQMENAKQVCLAGGAVMVREQDCTSRGLYDTVSSLLSDRTKLDAMAVAQRALGAPDAAHRICELILELCKN